MDEGDSAVQDLLVALAFVGIVIGALFLYTGNWPPPVVVESNSMMHVDFDEYDDRTGTTRADGVPYGRLGTIDPGDLVLVKQAPEPDEIDTFADNGDDRYGEPGEVVVYFPHNQRQATPIIHRAMTHVTVVDAGGERNYEVRWNQEKWDAQKAGAEDCGTKDGRYVCTFGSEGVRIPSLNWTDTLRFSRSGFITQGDNVVGNTKPDQVLGIRSQQEPVPTDHVKGVARGELPWFGLIKLSFTGNTASLGSIATHPYYVTIGAMTAPQDLWVMLAVGLTFAGFAPVALDYGVHFARRQFENESGSPTAPQPPDEGPSSKGPQQPNEPPPGEEGEPGEGGDDAIEMRME